MSTSTCRRRAMCVLLIALAGCQSSTQPSTPPSLTQKQTESSPPPAQNTSTLESVHHGPPITDEEAMAFGRHMEAVVAVGDVAAFPGLFDWSAFGKVVGSHLSLYDDDRDFQLGMQKGVAAAIEQLPAKVIAQWEHTKYTHLGTRHRADGNRALFRMLTADGQLNYHEYCLVRRAGAVRAVDLYIFDTGERLTDAIQQTMVRLLPPSKVGDRIATKKARQDIKLLDELRAAHESGEHQTVLNIYRTLPKEIQQEK